MDDAVSLARLKRAAEQLEAARADADTRHGELVTLVRLAGANGIPKTRIADTIGVNRETVARWCKEDERG